MYTYKAQDIENFLSTMELRKVYPKMQSIHNYIWFGFNDFHLKSLTIFSGLEYKVNNLQFCTKASLKYQSHRKQGTWQITRHGTNTFQLVVGPSVHSQRHLLQMVLPSHNHHKHHIPEDSQQPLLIVRLRAIKIWRGKQHKNAPIPNKSTNPLTNKKHWIFPSEANSCWE